MDFGSNFVNFWRLFLILMNCQFSLFSSTFGLIVNCFYLLILPTSLFLMNSSILSIQSMSINLKRIVNIVDFSQFLSIFNGFASIAQLVSLSNSQIPFYTIASKYKLKSINLFRACSESNGQD